MLSFARDAKKNLREKWRMVLVKQRIGIHRQHIRQPQCQKLAVEEHLRTWGDVVIIYLNVFIVKD